MIELLRHYRGKPSGEQRIAKGVYAQDDPRLMRLGPYLVSIGIARYVDAPDAPETDDAAAGDRLPLKDYTRAELVALLKDNDVSIPDTGSGANGNVIRQDLEQLAKEHGLP